MKLKSLVKKYFPIKLPDYLYLQITKNNPLKVSKAEKEFEPTNDEKKILLDCGISDYTHLYTKSPLSITD